MSIINDYIKEGLKFVNYEKLREGTMILKEIKLAKTSHGNDIILFEGEAVNSKGIMQPNNITKRLNLAEDTEEAKDSVKFAVGYVVKLLNYFNIDEQLYVNAETLSQFLQIATKETKGKEIRFNTTTTKVGQLKIEEKEFVFKK